MKPVVPAALAVLIAALPAAGQSVCRPNALGGVACLGPVVPPPLPRPPIEPDARGLDAVLDRRAPEAGLRPPVPPRRTNSFGDTRLDAGEAGPDGGPCRRGALGTLRCR